MRKMQLTIALTVLFASGVYGKESPVTAERPLKEQARVAPGKTSKPEAGATARKPSKASPSL